MGALVEGLCFSTNALAADHYFSNQGDSFTPGATSYHSWFEKTAGGVWQIKRQSISSTGVITNLTASNATVPTFPVCDPIESFSDGLAVGWGIATVMVMAWGYNKIRQQAR